MFSSQNLRARSLTCCLSTLGIVLMCVCVIRSYGNGLKKNRRSVFICRENRTLKKAERCQNYNWTRNSYNALSNFSGRLTVLSAGKRHKGAPSTVRKSRAQDLSTSTGSIENILKIKLKVKPLKKKSVPRTHCFAIRCWFACTIPERSHT